MIVAARHLRAGDLIYVLSNYDVWGHIGPDDDERPEEGLDRVIEVGRWRGCVDVLTARRRTWQTSIILERDESVFAAVSQSELAMRILQS